MELPESTKLLPESITGVCSWIKIEGFIPQGHLTRKEAPGFILAHTDANTIKGRGIQIIPKLMIPWCALINDIIVGVLKSY